MEKTKPVTRQAGKSLTSKWPAFNVERRKVTALKPHKGNARTHSKTQVAQIVASIMEWGWTQPILIDARGGVIAGHGRLLAAQEMELDEVALAKGPCRYLIPNRDECNIIPFVQ